MPGHEVYLREAGLALQLPRVARPHRRRTRGRATASTRPILSPGGIVFFGRDMESSRQVWSAESGYPGDFDYREFYKDVGWELPLEYLGDVLPDGMRKNLGIKYYRVTGKVGPRRQAALRARAGRWRRRRSHAGNFLEQPAAAGRSTCAGAHGPAAVVVSPYDAELFGHWWFEGPDFLNFLFRKMHFDQDVVKPITPSEYLERLPGPARWRSRRCAPGARRATPRSG